MASGSNKIQRMYEITFLNINIFQYFVLLNIAFGNDTAFNFDWLFEVANNTTTPIMS